MCFACCCVHFACKCFSGGMVCNVCVLAFGYVGVVCLMWLDLHDGVFVSVLLLRVYLRNECPF